MELLQMPSYREKNPRIVCPAMAGHTLYIFVAVHGDRAVHGAPPQGPCGVSDEFIVQLETVGWRP